MSPLQTPGLRSVSYTNPPKLAPGLLNHILSQEYLVCPAVWPRPRSVTQPATSPPGASHQSCPGIQDSPATIK